MLKKDQQTIIKPKAICIFQYSGKILVAEYQDPEKNKPFYRPLGGTIEFCEHSKNALAREIKEELGAEVINLRRLGVIENIYHFKGKDSYEILFIYNGEFVDDSLYMISSFNGIEGERKFEVYWKPIEDFLTGKEQLYPEGLLDLILEKVYQSTKLSITEEIFVETAL